MDVEYTRFSKIKATNELNILASFCIILTISCHTYHHGGNGDMSDSYATSRGVVMRSCRFIRV